MKRIWEMKKRSLEKTLREYAARSPVMSCLNSADMGLEWRSVIGFATRTLVKPPGREITRVGPVIVGIRYHERFLSEVPNPFEIATVLFPSFIFHPNCGMHGGTCLGHPTPGIGLDQVLHQMWAGLTFQMAAVNTEIFDVANRDAAAYVRDNATDFPITARGLFEEPDAAWENSVWFAPANGEIEAQFRFDDVALDEVDETFPAEDSDDA